VVPWTEFAWEEAEGPIEAEARVALAAARTERTAAILLDQLRGCLRSALETNCDRIQSGQLQAAEYDLEQLLECASLGLHLEQPFRVVLTGRPNVGKSSLINAMLGYQRSIVFEQPGTTRDVVTAHTAIAGWPVELADTAGLRASDCEIEAAGVSRARSELASADAIVLVFDASVRWDEHDAALLRDWPSAVVVHNKADIAAACDDRPPGLLASAKTGQGIIRLIDLLAARLVAVPPAPGTAVPFTPRQTCGIQQALDILKRGEPGRATEMIGELMGRRGI
jgi:tRNA modification GTPase